MTESTVPLWKRRRVPLIALALSAFTAAVFLQTAWFDFTNYDEHMMVVRNPVVRAGITLQGIGWALTTFYFEYWHPLTWLSHMLDAELFGGWAGGHHLVSVAIHVLNTVLLFTFLNRSTAQVWPSAFVAALFALHPLKVESVVWIAERKDVLSATFFFLALHAYARFVEAKSREADAVPAHKKGDPHSAPLSRFYQRIGLLAFAGGLMVKPMVVTLPFVLLLLDVWPFNRFRPAEWRSKLLPLVREKTGYWVLMVLGCIISYVSVKAGNSIIDASKLPWSARLTNVPLSYLDYIRLTLWPADLIPVYPPHEGTSVLAAFAAALLLAGFSIFVFLRSNRAPFLFTGWFIFIGMLVPTIGIVAVSTHPVADRYSYITSTGLFIIVAWGAASVIRRLALPAVGAAFIGVAVVVFAAVGAWKQAGYWRDSITLWTRCVQVNPKSVVALYNLGLATQSRGDLEVARNWYERVLAIKPDHLDALHNLGTVHLGLQDPAGATNWFSAALRVRPEYAKSLSGMAAARLDQRDYFGALRYSESAINADPNSFGPYVTMGRALSAQGQSVEALRLFQQALRLNPASPQTHLLIAQQLMNGNDTARAADHLVQAIELSPRWAEPRLTLASLLSQQGRIAEAVAQYRTALQLEPNSVQALNNLAWLLATAPDPEVRNGEEAVRLAKQACEQTNHKEPFFIGTLGAAHAQAGNWEDAIASAQRAVSLALAAGNTNVAEANHQLLLRYRNRQTAVSQ